MRQKLLLLTTVLTLAFATGQLSAQCVGATPGFCERPLIILPGGYFPGITVMNPDPMSGGVWSCREDFEAYLTSPGPFFFFAYDIDPAMCPFPSGTAPLCFEYSGGGCGPGMQMVTIRAIDDEGNLDSNGPAMVMAVINDIIAPTITPAAAPVTTLTECAATGVPSVVWTPGTPSFQFCIDANCYNFDANIPTATDNCIQTATGTTALDNSQLSVSINFGLSDPPGTCPRNVVIEWVAADDCGNPETYTQTVTISDDPPTFTDAPGSLDQTISLDQVDAICPAELDPDNILFCCGPPGDYPSIGNYLVYDPIGGTFDFQDPASAGDDEVLGVPTATDACTNPLTLTIVSFTPDNSGSPCTFIVTVTWEVSDDCGNTANFDQVITFIDDDAPNTNTPTLAYTADCADNLDPDCAGGTVPTPTAGITPLDDFSDVCFLLPPGCTNATPTAASPAGIYYNDGTPTACVQNPGPNLTGEYTFDRTWWAVDECGNISDPLVQTITVQDQVAPAFAGACPIANENLLVTGGADCPDVAGTDLTVGGTVAEGANFTVAGLTRTAPSGLTDNCSSTITLTSEAISITPSGVPAGCETTIVITWRATDECGNFSECDQTFTVIDDEAPVFDATNIDQDLILDEVDAPCPWELEAIGAVNYLVYDAVGGTFDFIDPVATPGSDESTSLPFPTATDDCNNGVTLSISGFTEDNSGLPCTFVVTVHWVAEDDCGNATPMTFDQVITFIDQDAPNTNTLTLSHTADCADNLDPDCAGGTVPTPTVGIDPSTDFSDYCFVLSGTCTNAIPTAADPAGLYYNDGTPTACVQNPGPNLTGEYTFDRTWWAVDECGNISDPLVQTITVQDQVAPAFAGVCPIPNENLLTSGGADCPAVAGTDLTDGGTVVEGANFTVAGLTRTAPSGLTDNCSSTITLTSETINITTGDCSTTIEITWRATDECGNYSECLQTFTVIDDESPTFNEAPNALDETISLTDPDGPCPDDFVAGDFTYDGTNLVVTRGAFTTNLTAPTATDNCQTPTISIASVVMGGPQCLRTATITWEADDNCGNAVANYVQVITLDDDANPYFNLAAGALDATVDACPIDADSWSFSEFTPTGGQALAINIAQGGGTVSAGTRYLRIEVPGGAVGGITNDFFRLAPQNGDGVDNCGILDMDIVSAVLDPLTFPACTRLLTVTWEAEDVCGNFSDPDFVQVITIQDVEGPVFTSTAPDDATPDCYPALDYYLSLVTAVDCPNTAVDITISDTDNGGTGCIGDPLVIVRTYTATDECGNVSTDTQEITVIDDRNPVFTVFPADETVACDAVPAADIALVEAIDSTNCAGAAPTITHEGDVTAGNSCSYTITRTYRATDACGNFKDSVQVITVVDDQGPDLSGCPSLDATIQCSASNQANADAFNTTLIALIGACATDNCNGIGTVTSDYDFNNFVGACGNTGSITITFEVPDGCGNITTATATLTIEDTTDPTWTTAPANGSESCDGNGNATGFNAWLSSNAGAAADDVCGTTTITSDFVSFVAGNCPGTGVYTYNFTATDECGNDISQTATFTIDDAANPTITCPADATINCGDPMDPSVTGTATATDVCDSDVAITYTDGAPVVNGCTQTVTRTWTATDACGNTDQCDQIITIVDNEAPVFTSLPSGIIDEYLTDVDGPCPSAIIFDTDLPNGNCSSSQFMGIGADGNAYLYNFDGPCAIDDCNTSSISVISTLLVNDGCTKLFELTWTVEDACGNQDVFIQSIGFYDLATPEWTSANPIIVDADCATVDVAAIKAANAPTATDNCIATVTEGATTTIAGNCTGNYTLVVAYTVEDACGNTNPTTAELRINVTDTNAPTFTASPSDLTMECDGSGNTAGLNAWLSSNGTTGAASDDCGTVSWSYQLAGSVAGACNGTGSWTYWFIATDDCGNSSSESATVTIEDTTDPVVTCPADVTIQCGDPTDPSATGTATATDVCNPNGVTVTYSDVLVTGCTSTITRTWTATDACGNTDQCDQIITIVDTEAPVFTSVPAAINDEYLTEIDGPCPSSIVLDGDFAAGANCRSVTFSGVGADGNTYFYDFDGPCAIDDCNASTITLASNVLLNDGCAQIFELTWTVEDACGNQDVFVQSIGFFDQAAPAWTSPSPILLQASCTDDIPALIAANIPTATDNCVATVSQVSNVTVPGNCAGNYTVVVTYEAEDDCSNVASAPLQVVIEVSDDTAPVIGTAPVAATWNCENGSYTADLNAWLASNGGAAATDDCSGVTWSHSLLTSVPGCGNTITFTYEFTATDGCGNASSASATYSVVDNTAPVVTVAPANETVECDGNGNQTELDVWLLQNGGAAATDGCGSVTWSHSLVSTTPACGGTSTAVYAFTATDECGNSATAVNASFIIIDTTDPDITVQASDVTVECDGAGNMAELNAWLAANGGAVASDLCSGVTWTNTPGVLVAGCGGTTCRDYTFTATDGCGNASSTTATFCTEDTTAPAWTTLPADMNVSCSGNFTTQLVAWLNSYGGGVAADQCGGNVSYAYNLAASVPGCGNTITYIYDFRATDACGNVAMAQASFSNTDVEAPMIVTPAQNYTAVCDGAGNFGELALWLLTQGGAFATDNCGQVSWTFQLLSTTPGCGNTSTRTYRFTARDLCGNTSTTDADFIITDNVAPYFTQLPNPLANITCDQSFPAQQNLAAFDQCGGPNVTVVPSVDPFVADQCAGYTVTYRWTATDACGNSTSVTQSFSVLPDTQGPVFTTDPSNLTVECDGTGNIGDLNAWLAINGGAVAADACGTVTWSVVAGPTSDACGETGCAVYTFTATDNCNNATTRTALFCIEDTTAPDITTPAADLVVECDGAGNLADLNAWLAANGGAVAVDQCGGTIDWSYELLSKDNTCGSTSTSTYRFTVSDGCGNTASVTANFVIEDTTGPTIDVLPSNMTVQCDGNGNTGDLALWLAANGGASASDLCGSVTWSHSLVSTTPGACAGTSTRVYSFVATDDCGNSSSASASFIIVDNVAPVFTSNPQNVQYECDLSLNPGQLAAWLAASANAVAVDACSGSTVAITNQLLSTAQGCGGTSTRSYLFIATDGCGNSATKIASFTTVDTQAPVLVGIPADVILDCSQPIPPVPVVIADDCNPNIVVMFNQTTQPINGNGTVSVIVRTWTANDGCGNISTGRQTITVLDNTPPTVSNCPGNIGPIVSPNGACVVVNWVPPTFNDNCGSGTLVVTSTHNPGFCFPVGTTTVVYTATDLGGNVTTCSFNVTISAYCTIPSTGTQNYIHKFVFNGVENTSGNNGGYADFTNISTNVVPGQTLVVSLIPGSAGGFNVMGFWRIWIDYNRDGDFTDVGELVLQQSGVGPLVGLFTVPAQMTPGPTRMRVYMNRFAFPNPCDHHLGLGEAEDYTVNVSATRTTVTKDADNETEIGDQPADMEFEFGFIAKEGSNEVDLTWITNTEFKNDRFVVERSQDGQTFEPIMTIESTKDTDSEIYYRTKDKQPLKGVSFYRLKQVYNDGTFDYSDTRKVYFGLSADAIGLYPNPASDIVNIDLSEYAGQNVRMVIFNSLMQAVYQQDFDQVSEGTIEVNVSDLAGGNYNAVFYLNGERVAKKFMVRK